MGEEGSVRRLTKQVLRAVWLLAIAGGVALSLGCEVPIVPQPTGPVPITAVKVAYMAGNELWTVNWDGSEPMRVAGGLKSGLPGCRPYYISPNGRLVAYQTVESQLWIAETRGPVRRQLAQGSTRSVCWFPDSRGLVYSLNEEIYIHPLDEAQNPQAIATGGSRYCCPAWSFDGRYVAFLESTGAGNFNVNLIKVETQDVRVLGATATASRGGMSICPDIVAWSLDSTKFLVDYGQPVFIFYVAGGTPVQVSSCEEGLSHHWSPDSQTIAFKEKDGSLWLVNADGSGQRPLVAEAIGQLAWSPVGMNIAYTTGAASGLNDLWLANAADGERRQLTADDAYIESFPLWTSDGSRIIFRRTGVQGEEAGVWSVAADGRDLRQLSTVGTAVEVFAVR